jgi:ATP-dependent DNA helicase RecG
MTVFGDMETSTLTELPRGRAPITTHVVPTDNPRWVERTWHRVAEEVRSGRQAYVVCPRIGDAEDARGGVSDEEVADVPRPAGNAGDDAMDERVDETRGEDGALGREGEGSGEQALPRTWASALAVAEQLRSDPALHGISIDVLHGRMPAEEKDAAMARFTRGETGVLVSTTVIEVGVDVANATVMVVMDADRFGVSQLHQLRGRVGRGGHPGLCLLMTGADAEGGARERLDAVASTTDGFALAQLDLELRGTGDLLSGRQSGSGQLTKSMGRGSFRFLSLLRDEELILQAREDAATLVAADPDLEAHPELAASVAERRDEQAAFLERG